MLATVHNKAQTPLPCSAIEYLSTQCQKLNNFIQPTRIAASSFSLINFTSRTADDGVGVSSSSRKEDKTMANKTIKRPKKEANLISENIPSFEKEISRLKGKYYKP